LLIGYNARVQKFDGNGNFITKWGSTGTADGQFNVPIGIAINSKGLVYVTDNKGARVQIFAPSIPK
jgi:NHL repeat